MHLTNRELIEMNWLTFCESSSWLSGWCDKVLEFGNWANCLKEQTFVWLFRFLESFYLWQKTLDFKLKSKITGVPLAFDDSWNTRHGCWRVVFYRKPQSKFGCFVFAFCSFLTVTVKIYDYILNIWTDSLWKCQMLGGKSNNAREMQWFLPSNMRSRYNHESLGRSVGICEIIYFGFNLKDKESTWWISF